MTCLSADILYGSVGAHEQRFKAGDPVVRRIVVFFAEVSPEKTAALAKSVRVEERPQRRVLHFKLSEGGRAEVPLL
jgi:hypothetical protein